MHPIPVLASFAALLLSAPTLLQARNTEPDPVLEPYLSKHCLKCHDAKEQKGDFRIDNLSRNIGFENTPQWQEILERINSGEMPPKKEKERPSAELNAQIVDVLASRIKEGQSARMATRGLVSYNRLSRDEYVYTIQDLFGVTYDAKDPGAFLEDPDWHGFERIGSVLTLSPSNIEKYLAAAETIFAEAYPEKKTAPYEGTKRALLETQVNERHRERLRSLGLLDKIRYDMWPGDVFRYSNLQEPLPESGVYEISYTLSGLKPEKGRAPRIKVYEEKLDRVLHEQDVIAPEDQPVTITFRAHLQKGRPNIHVYNDVPGPSNLPRSGRHGDVPFISIKEGRIPWQMKLTDEQGRARYPFLILDSISWKGPIVTEDELQRRAAYMPKEEGNLDQVRACLATLAKRAFRRPVTDAELDGFVAIVRSELDAKEKFRDAMKAGVIAILCSKSFLFLTEGDAQALRHTLTDWEIASRLSYLLWSTMPDEALLEAAEKGLLRERSQLRAQVARMLADPRSARFADAFASQWLRLRKVGMFQPDKKLFPDYDKHLETSMIGETRAFFREVLQKNLSLGEFLHSDWTMLNARLVQFYGLDQPGIAGDEFQRVLLPGDGKRGGLLTQASILSLTSDGTRHRPVHRGVWVMESIFGKSPPPPPANVEPIAPTPVSAPKATLRMKLEAHISNANCAACHARIDPLGLAFENYDAIGRWRTEEFTEGMGDNPPLNPSGTLPDGRSYASPQEFKNLLLGDLDTFAQTFVEKLAAFGLRRPTSFDDKERLRAIAAEAKKSGYHLQSVLEAFVCSELFQMR